MDAFLSELQKIPPEYWQKWFLAGCVGLPLGALIAHLRAKRRNE
ncbi:hypothetical protein [Tautonia plasticadhaerens]|uniref:Uncharacterized protein n=1 Tax=Tautonia plasticadhaerens TaxID=2527974 RepID=A0A518H2B0_9BACT|nr:hypothetical protein [Tautonia plasticadhaerens]QDV34992.1 hypothetical protein ElP_28890 [Tautonia plasticadhaerens]